MSTPNRIELPLFPNDKRIAVTTSWDDGTIYDRKVVAGLNALGIKGTFNLNSGHLIRKSERHITAEEVPSLFAGHEVAIHTKTHPWLERLDASQIASEVLEDRKYLEDLVGYPVRGMAYPFGTYNAQVIQVLRALGIVYSRTTANQDNPWPAPEPLAWSSTMHMFGENPTPLPERFTEFYERRNRTHSGLFYVWGHSYEFAVEDPKHNWSNLERLFSPLAGKPDVWYCTNIELYDYHAARQALVLAANRQTAYNPSAITVFVKADGKLIPIPAGQTVRLEV